jgi:hypothetical protein
MNDAIANETRSDWIARRAHERTIATEDESVLDTYRRQAEGEGYPMEDLSVRILPGPNDIAGYVFSDETIVATWSAKRPARLPDGGCPVGWRQIHVGLWFDFNGPEDAETA